MIVPDVQTAHVHCMHNRADLPAGARAGCFYCEQTYDAAEIREWTDNDDTALCPRCGIDAVLSERAAPIHPAFLAQMHHHWFETTVTAAEAARRLDQTEHSS
jgi:NAD-dependent SIR2 family protein deacetylase